MVVLLPKEMNGLPELEKAITVEKLASLLSKLQNRKVIAFIPKFKMETSFGLKPTLEKLGMKRAFSGEADFSGISGQKDLCISAVIHKAYVDVNEEGTEAAAATAVVMRFMAVRRPDPTPIFRADHPFLFLIRDTKAGNILFMGRLTNPTK
jgi:serpin B